MRRTDWWVWLTTSLRGLFVSERIPAPRTPWEVTIENLTDDWFIAAAKESLRLRRLLPQDDPDAWPVDDDATHQSTQ